jgi:hypothetical protein
MKRKSRQREQAVDPATRAGLSPLVPVLPRLDAEALQRQVAAMANVLARLPRVLTVPSDPKAPKDGTAAAEKTLRSKPPKD